MQLHKAKVILVDEKAGSRKAARDALQEVGFRIYQEISSLEEVAIRLASADCDVLICDADTDGGGAIKLFNDIRHGDIGLDPFIPIIATTWKPQQEMVRQIISSGADLLLVLPMTIGKMKTAIETLISNRKPFVVTSDYIGPDRRTDPREDEKNPIQQIHVPNKLRHIATGDDGGVNVESVQTAVQEQRVERYVNKILVTVRMITSMPDDKRSHLPRLLKELAESAEMLDNRIGTTRFNHQAELSKTLLVVGQRMAASETPKPSDMELVRQLGGALQLAMTTEDQASVDAAMNITNLLKG